MAAPRRDYYYTSPPGCRLFDLGLGPVALAFCAAASPADQALIDSLCVQESPGGFAGALLGARGLAWAADLLGAWPGPHTAAPSLPDNPEEDLHEMA